MRKCRFCKGDVDDAATVCPHCHQDLIPGRSASPAAGPPGAPDAAAIARVTVVDIDMPFASMVGFMVKWALAAIPALLIIGALAFVLGIFFGGLASACAPGRTTSRTLGR